MIIYGTKGRIRPSKPNDTLKGACPQCNNHLELSDLKRWFTLYFIPLFPFRHVDTFYYCRECQLSYKKEARGQLMGGKQGRQQLKNENDKAFARTLITCIAYMASADGTISGEEDRMIKDRIQRFSEHRGELENIYNTVSLGQMKESDVEAELRKASGTLTTEGILMLIAEIAKMVLADGRIDREEERLMKHYMKICGVSEGLYETVLAKAKQ